MPPPRHRVLGPIAYHFYHRPLSWARDLVADGGPWERRRTARGRLAMSAAARELPPLPPAPGSPLLLHLLSGARFWDQSVFCLWSLARCCGRPVAPIIYDDGTLASEHREPLARVFPAIRFIARAEIEARLEALLPVSRFPYLRERWSHYPNIRKLIDPHLGSNGWKLVLDSDLLFFRHPKMLVDWLDQPQNPLHAVDCQTSYSYSRPLMDELAGAPVADLVNVGLTGLNSASLDWDRLESWCNRLITRERTHYYLEQALVAMCVAGRPCSVLPAADYVTCPRLPEARECRAVMHHYVAQSKRWHFQHNWRRVLADAA